MKAFQRLRSLAEPATLCLLWGTLGCVSAPARTAAVVAPTPVPSIASWTVVEPNSSSPLEPGAPPAGALSQQDEQGWRYVIAPYGWLLSVDGDARIDDTSTRIEEDFGDLLDKISFVLEGRFEAWKGDWGVLADLTYARLENDVDLGMSEAETKTDMIVGVLGALYRFVEQAPQGDGSGGVEVDGLAGIGITSLDAEIDISGSPDVTGDDTWVDPVLGLRTRWHFSEKWGGHIEGIIGGFELFDGSELFSMFTILVGRKVGEQKHLFFGWRNLDIDYDGGSAIDADVRFSGPIVGFEMGL